MTWRVALEAMASPASTRRSSHHRRPEVRVQTPNWTRPRSARVRAAIGEEVGVPPDQVTYSLIVPRGATQIPTGHDRAGGLPDLGIAVIAIYFRNWKMAAAALLALVHDLVLTLGIYAWSASP